MGRRSKDGIEISASGRVCQTAFHADPVPREFLGEDGLEGRLDLAFDTDNVQGIFKMTAS